MAWRIGIVLAACYLTPPLPPPHPTPPVPMLGLLPALFQGPLSRFGDTAANEGVKVLLESAGLSVMVVTFFSSWVRQLQLRHVVATVSHAFPRSPRKSPARVRFIPLSAHASRVLNGACDSVRFVSGDWAFLFPGLGWGLQASSAWRIVITPLATLKTSMQVNGGAKGIEILAKKVRLLLLLGGVWLLLFFD